MKVHGMEWKLVSQVQAHHNHPCHPEEKNVRTSLKEGCWVECLQIVRLLRPSHDREGEKARGEPCVKNILITFKYDIFATTSKKCFCFDVCILLTPCHQPAIIVRHVRFQNSLLTLLGRKPRWNLMTPPKLPAHAPITNVIQPMEPRLFMIGRYNLQFLIAHRVRGLFGHSIAVDIPLESNHGFKNITRAGAQTQAHFVGFLSDVKALFIQRLLDSNASVVTHQTLELGSIVVDRSIQRKDSDELQFVTFTTFVIVRVMGGRNLHGTGTKLHVDKCGITDNGDTTPIKGMDHMLSMKVRVSRILRMDRHGCISQHGLQTSGRHNQLFLRIFNWVGK
mmetsp:Transcript_18515/g.40082  ORF Transcript_18515/g.40082 Transcript_18515/m.40082 type:complete len:336 (-) Transcript_18515:391-1398(-)